MASVLYRLRAGLASRMALAWWSSPCSSGCPAAPPWPAWRAARRTDTAFARMRQATHAWDVMVNPNNGTQSKLDRGRAAPAARGRAHRPDRRGHPLPLARQVGPRRLQPPARCSCADPDATYTVGRPVMVAGRQPARRRSRRGLGRPHLRPGAATCKVGQTFTYTLITPDLLQRLQRPASEAEAHALILTRTDVVQGHARIDGIGVTSDGVVVDPGYTPRRSCSPRPSEPPTRICRVPYWGAMVG